MASRPKFLIIQTAFIGDVVLATPLADELKRRHPEAEVHFLLRKGNESLLENHPSIDRVFIWNKKKKKYRNLLRLVKELRKEKYTGVFNLQRFLSTGLISLFLKANSKAGFDKNPLSFFYTRSVPHRIPDISNGESRHEVSRNLSLLPNAPEQPLRPTLYPSPHDLEEVEKWKKDKPYFVIAPSSVWFTKQLPAGKWRELLERLPLTHRVYLVGAANEKEESDSLLGVHPDTVNLCGRLSYLQTVALMQEAERVFTNDSAPLHFASAANAAHTAVFCSTVPEFGFGPLSQRGRIAQTHLNLECRPCGLHGKRKCPKKHFKCATSIRAEDLFNGKEYLEAVKGRVNTENLFDVAAYFMDQGKIISIDFKGQQFYAGPFAAYKKMQKLVKKEEMALYIRDFNLLKYLVDQVPEEIFRKKDQSKNQDVRLHFPSLKSPTARVEDKVQMPVIITHNESLKKLLEKGSGIFVLGKSGDDGKNTAFHLPVDEKWQDSDFMEFHYKAETEEKV